MGGRLLQGTWGIEHSHPWIFPPRPKPHTAAVSILSTFPDFRFIIIPLLMSTSDEFHREWASLSGFCHFTFGEFCACPAPALTSLPVCDSGKKKMWFLSGMGWGWSNGWWDRLVCSAELERTKLKIYSLIEGPSKILMLTAVWIRMAASLPGLCWYQHWSMWHWQQTKGCFSLRSSETCVRIMFSKERNQRISLKNHWSW